MELQHTVLAASKAASKAANKAKINHWETAANRAKLVGPVCM